MGTLPRLRALGVIVAAAAMIVALAPSVAASEETTTTTTSTTSTTTPASTTTTTSAAPAPTAPAQPAPQITFKPVKRYDVLKKLVFPVIGVTKYWSGFGDCRDHCTREHHGIDILTYGYKGLPVVAAHDGVVTKVTYDEGNAGCSVRIRGRDRWETRYYHLNTDHPGTDESGAPCPAPGIEVGVEVEAGQIIGYIGDSGNSEHTVPHLHFELRSRSGYPIDPYRSLKAAKKVTFEWMVSDPQDAIITLNNASRIDDVSNLVVVCGDEWDALAASEEYATILESPVVVMDRNEPIPAIEEIRRLQPERIIVLSDMDSHWMVDLVRSHADIVERAPLPDPSAGLDTFEPDALEPQPFVHNPEDRFTTLIAGATHKIWRSKRPAYEAFIADHRSIVVDSQYWAPRGLGHPTRSWPGKYADKNSLWWHTWEGWMATELDGEAPAPGIAYVTERRAEAHTLAYLGSLAELPPYPIWRSS